jgi:L-cysteine desulfidase
MGMPVTSFSTFKKQMSDNFGIDINKMVYNQIEEILTNDVCNKIIKDNKF